MKATFFQKPFEFNLTVDGESWHQQDSIEGSLHIKSHTGDTLPASQVKVFLAYGEARKVKAKSPGAFLDLKPVDVSSAGPMDYRWKLQLDPNCHISDKSGSLYVLYGTEAHQGNIQLNVIPRQIFLDFVELMTIHFKFALRFTKSKKDWVEIKFVPPTGGAFPAVEALMLNLKMSDELLQARYLFNTKVLDVTASAMEITKQKKRFEQSFTPVQYLLSNHRLNHEFIQGAVETVLNEHKSPHLS